ncbi:DUF6716 putative glycosyltransferase [Profundibacter sp.]
MSRALQILIPFCDDSTLIFATRMRKLLQDARHKPQVDLAYYQPEASLSARQFEMLLPGEEYAQLDFDGLGTIAASGQYDAILSSRIFRPLTMLLQDQSFKDKTERAQIFGFLGGLDFFPEQGLMRRKYCDGVYLFPRPVLEQFRTISTCSEVGFGHPSFLRPVVSDQTSLDASGDIYFFTQAISPTTRRGRRHMLAVMAAIARANPERKVWIKLRHLPEENQLHLHREKHDYPGLFAADLPNPPANLALTACSMDEALKGAALGITCTSTAAIDLVREAVPTMVYLDYVDNYADPLAAPMRRLFAGSNLITPLEDVLNLRSQRPNENWINEMFCPRDLADQILERIARLSLL